MEYMKPQDKARDLIIKFLPIVVKDSYHESELTAIRSALVLTKEMIGHCEINNDSKGKCFWKKVKKELKLMINE